MLTKMLPFPTTIDEIPVDYEIRLKGDWRGVWANLTGALLWLGLNLYDKRLAFGWVAGCALAMVGSIVATATFAWSPWWVVVPVLMLLAYPIALRAGAHKLAQNVWQNFTMAISGRVYALDLANVSAATIIHEGVHIWQRSRAKLGGLAHDVRYTLDPRGLNVPVLRDKVAWYRAHSEAQAYAIEVALGHRSMTAASVSLAKKVYATGLTRADAWALLTPYVECWQDLIEAPQGT